MHASSSAIRLGLLLVAGASTARGATASVGGARRIELEPNAPGAWVEVAVSPGLSTVLLFDSELVQEATEIEGLDSFSNVDSGRTTMRLVPSARASPGEKFRVAVRFRDGAAPVGASFLLVVHPARADALVEVYRNKRTVESYQEETREARAATLRCQEENVRIVSEHGAPGGLTGLLAAGSVDDGGLAGKKVTESITPGPKNALSLFRVHTYRSVKRVALEIWLTAQLSETPWVASGAVLRSSTGIDVKVLSVWQDAPATLGEPWRMVVEAEAPADASRGTFSLKLWEDAGPRTVTLGGVTFP
ncbi:DUF2381 family protein [Corallococcus terminator]